MSLVQLSTTDKIRGFGKFLSTSLGGRPYGVTLELTRRCNAKCDYCDHWREAKRDELTTEGFVDVVRHFDPLSVTLCGGEPLIRKDAVDILRGIKALPGYRFTAIITNGWFMKEDKAMELVNAGIDQINISLNYPDERQDEDRKLKGLFSRISHIVPWLTSRGVNVQLNTIFMKDNFHELMNIVKLAESWKAAVLFTLYSELPGGNKTHLFPKEMWPDVRQMCSTFRTLRKEKGLVANEDWYLEMVPRYVEGELIGGCTAGKRVVHVTPEGLVRPCAELPPVTTYKEYSVRAQPATDCTACFQACRGEAQAPLTLKRIAEYLAA